MVPHKAPAKLVRALQAAGVPVVIAKEQRRHGTIHRMSLQVLIAGGGIAGLAAALACGRAGCDVRLFEQAAALEAVGAGIQIGPNVTRLLHGWGLADGLRAVAAFPSHLQVRNALSGRGLGVLPLGDTALQRYGAPYATLHRGDLQQLLLNAVRQQTGAELQLDDALSGFAQTPQRVTAQLGAGRTAEGDVLLGADGLWSVVRQGLLNDGPPRVTGHLAYRALARQASLPAHLRSHHVTVWLGPDLHVVHYPVRNGEWLNVVGIVQTRPSAANTISQGAEGDAARVPGDWNQETTAAHLLAALADTCAPLRDLVNAMDGWRRWVLCDRAPLSGADRVAGGRVALLGDAAHPMLPYLAQGAGMAIEDAAELGRVLANEHADVMGALRAYAGHRWQRNARVQARSLRNGRIFHAQGIVRWGRDMALGLLGDRLLDLPWLYRP
jgi:salicylate hydroxylase